VSTYLEKFLDYQAQLLDSVRERPEVIGLIFVGSAAATERVDQHSDQDFFLVVHEGTAEGFRKNLSWLPNHGQIALHPRETAHGLKVVYQNGDVLEFAVFQDSELELAAANDYRVDLDRKDIADRMEKIAKRSIPAEVNRSQEFELFLSLILIGVGRARRGEVLAAEQHIKAYALNNALRLIRLVRPVSASKKDSLNAYRRFELDYPELGGELGEVLLMPTEESAKSLAVLVLREIRGDDREFALFRLVADRFGWD
jgi:lincosamide nucleotidyltransferase